MIADKKEFGLGLTLFVGFWIVFAILMSPVFAGKNLLDYMDNLYNSISKHSAYYIPEAKEEAAKHLGKEISFSVKTQNPDQAARLAGHFEMIGAEAAVEESTLKVSGDMGQILTAMLEDADLMYSNDGGPIAAKYGTNERQVVYDWWTVLKKAQDDFNRREMFAEGKVFYNIMARGIEPAYNYYQIQAQPIDNEIGVVVLSLVGYVLYTLWFGFSILFMFEGWGIRLNH